MIRSNMTPGVKIRITGYINPSSLNCPKMQKNTHRQFSAVFFFFPILRNAHLRSKICKEALNTHSSLSVNGLCSRLRDGFLADLKLHCWARGFNALVCYYHGFISQSLRGGFLFFSFLYPYISIIELKCVFIDSKQPQRNVCEYLVIWYRVDHNCRIEKKNKS